MQTYFHPGYFRPGAVVAQHSPHRGLSRVVPFGRDASTLAQSQKVQEEVTRLRQEERFKRVKLLAIQPFMTLLSFIFPTPLMGCWPGFIRLVKNARRSEEVLRRRAQFNVTRNPDALNAFLPYRRLLRETGKTTQLALYDARVKSFIEKIEFYESEEPKGFRQKLKELEYAHQGKAVKQDRIEYMNQKGGNPLKFVWNILTNHAFRQTHQPAFIRMVAQTTKLVTPEELSTVCKDLAPLQDPATQYYIAASIIELFQNRPEWLEPVFRRKHPFRVVITKDVPKVAAGEYRYGYNLMTTNSTTFWLRPTGSKTAQHEFVHALSEEDGTIGDTLPQMTDGQKRRFEACRRKMTDHYLKHDISWPARIRYWFKGNTSSGVSNYAFWNGYEFLTNTLDLFMKNPKNLCQTEAGKALYAVYQEMFGLDPLADYKSLKTPA